jgi:hypothetical protein
MFHIQTSHLQSLRQLFIMNDLRGKMQVVGPWQILKRIMNLPRSLRNCGLHPLIHTPLEFYLAQDVEKKKAEPKTPHFLSLNQDIVARSQEEECGLKYEMHSPGDDPGLQIITPK